MNLDDSSSCDLLELLEQARHDLQTCRKNLAFKESLLIDLELENAELTEANEKLDIELKCIRQRESRRSEIDGMSDDCVDDGYGHWSHDEDDFLAYSPTQASECQEKVDACSSCRTYAMEKDELYDRIEELHQQLAAVQEVNKLLQEDVNQKSAQIADLTEVLVQKEAREERLQADLEFTAAEREIALRDLHDSQSTMSSNGTGSEEYRRSSSIGSSIADELGLRRSTMFMDVTPDIRSFMDWDRILAEPEDGPLSDFELASTISSVGSLEPPPEPSSLDLGEFLVNGPKADTENVAASGIPCPPKEKSQEDWTDIRYSSHLFFGWRSLICCGAAPSSPLRQRPVDRTRRIKGVEKERSGILSFFKQRIVKRV